MFPRVMVMTEQQYSCLRPLGVDWPQIVGSTAQTSASTEDVDWAVLGVGEDVTAKAASKRPDANKHRQAIFPLSDDETEDADIFRLVPRKRRQLELTEQGGSSVSQGSHHRPLQHR